MRLIDKLVANPRRLNETEPMDMEALHEVQAANFLGYRRISDFRRAVKRGEIPEPDRQITSGPIWSRTRLQAWLDNDHQLGANKAGELSALKRLNGYGPRSD